MTFRRLILCALALSPAPIALAAEPSPASIELFERKVRPLLVDNCYNCHSANTNAKGGLRVDDRNGLINGGDSGAAIVPRHPEKRLLVNANGHGDADVNKQPTDQPTAPPGEDGSHSGSRRPRRRQA